MNTHLQVIEQARDTSVDWKVTLKPSPGRSELTYHGTEALTGKLWPGDNRPAIELDAAWLVAPDSVQVSVPASKVADLEPGKYRIRVYVDEGPGHAAEFILWLLDSPRVDTPAPKAYCTGRDVLSLVPMLSRPISLEEDQADFAEQRGLARQWFDGIVLAAYDPVGRNGNFDLTDAAWSFWDWTQDSDWLREKIDADCVVVDPEVRRCTAAYAAHLVLRYRPASPGQADWQAIARSLLAEAQDLARRLTVRIDADGDGQVDLRINLGQVRIRRG